MRYEDTPANRALAARDDVEWWQIERQATPSGHTTYGIHVFGERITDGHHSLFAAINHALAVLSGHDVGVSAESFQASTELA